LVKARIPCYLRMERGAEQVSLTNRHDRLILQLGEHLNTRAYCGDGWSTYEHRVERRGAQRWHSQVGFEARTLRTERVAPGTDVPRRQERLAGECVVRLTREQDQPRTGAPHWSARGNSVAQWLVQLVLNHQLAHHRAFAAGDDQPVHPGYFGR